MLTRRRALASICAAAAASILGRAAAAEEGPTFSRGGPNATLYGIDEGYPIPGRLQRLRDSNPWEPRYRVGAFSHLDQLYNTRTVERAATPWAFRRTATEIRYRFQGQPSSIDDYLSRNPVTGLLIAKDDRILAERYQYDRTDRDRLLGQSMVKSITGLLVGIAVGEGAIRSVDDTADTYVPAFKGSEYGRTPIRDLLHMASGVAFGEADENGRDLNRLWRDMVAGGWISNKGAIASITQFNQRIAPPGTRFRYASIEPDVLGVVLRAATGRDMPDYLREKLWAPIGAEADATWLVDAEGHALAHFGLSATLRDYARLGRLLAQDGRRDGTSIVPSAWMTDATTVRPSDAYLAPGRAMPHFGYGYLFWLLPGARRQFAMVGDYGQRLCVDPASKLVLVQTALDDQQGEAWRLWAALVEQFG